MFWGNCYEKSFRKPMRCSLVNAGLHNSESLRGQIDQHRFAAGRKSLFCCSLEEILKRQKSILLSFGRNSEMTINYPKS